MKAESLRWDSRNGNLVLLDQKCLPSEVRWVVCSDHSEVAKSIENMTVRGAPAIGIAAAYGMVLAARGGGLESVRASAERLAATRPTAVNLFWAINRMLDIAERAPSSVTLAETLLDEAMRIHAEDVDANRAMGLFGQELLPRKCAVLSHCNAGALATGGYGTALGMIRSAREQGKEVRVFLDETRPLLQGARLSAWELAEEGFEVTVICDGMAGALMKKGEVDAVIVGADRIASNGDFANKIGTYGVAVLAAEHGIPFYVAAPWSTFDTSIASGEDITIEERDEEEIRALPGGKRIPDKVRVWNPAFDVTPARLVTAFICEKGVFRFPFDFRK
jgi:methylthioribose-1-phosphate isomerase